MTKLKARAKASWVSLDIGNSAFATTVLAAVFPAYLPSILPKEGLFFDLGFLQWQSSAISIWGYTVSFSLFVTLIISLVLGAWADQKAKRKFLLIFFTCLGCFACICLGFVSYWPATLACFVVGNIGFAAANVFNNSLLSCVATEEEYDSLSLKAYAWGYIGGGLLLALNLLFILKFDWFGFESKTQGVRLSFMSAGIWWFLFSLPAFFYIHEPKLVRAEELSKFNRFKTLWLLVKSLPKTPIILFFILGYAFFNDGIQTVISMAAIFGKEVLQLQEQSIIGTLLLIQIVGWPLTLLAIFASKKLGAKKALSVSLSIWIGIVIYAFFMTRELDFWVLGLMVASVLGASQALARSIYIRLIPVGRHAEYFSLYAFSGKFSSIFGPLIFALIRDVTGSARYAILSLVSFFIIGLLFLQGVSIDPQKTKPLN